MNSAVKQIKDISNILSNKLGLLRLKQINVLLGYKDLRSVVSWCSTNEVLVIRQGNGQFVNSAQFIMAFYKPFINSLRESYDDWLERFVLCLKNDIHGLVVDTSVPKQSKSYKPSSKAESSFLDKMKNL